MICNVCKDGLEGMWDPSRSNRLCLLTDFRTDETPDQPDVAEGFDASKYPQPCSFSSPFTLTRNNIAYQQVSLT